MSDVPEKYTPMTMPFSPAGAMAMAVEREEWAKAARERDQPGSAREFELTALALRAYVEALALLGLINAEFQSDPTSVQCFDLRFVEQVKAFVERGK